MILRRLAEALRTQNWFTVVLEVAIVVVGIFIGLQVDDWNQSRKNQIDERTFLSALHEDVLRVDELSRRLRLRRQDRLNWTLDAGGVLFGQAQRESLTDTECAAIVWSSAFNITATGLPSVDELIGTGRMGIIQNVELRTGLVGLQQTRAALDATISEKTASSNYIFLPSAFPELFKMSMYFDDTIGEVKTKNECDLAAMRENQHFLNQFSAHADGYDAYIRDGLRPWSLQFDKVHTVVDTILSIDHEEDINE